MLHQRRMVDVDIIVTVAVDSDSTKDLSAMFEEVLMKFEIAINEMAGVPVEGGRGIIRAHIKGMGKEIPI